MVDLNRINTAVTTRYTDTEMSLPADGARVASNKNSLSESVTSVSNSSASNESISTVKSAGETSWTESVRESVRKSVREFFSKFLNIFNLSTTPKNEPANQMVSSVAAANKKLNLAQEKILLSNINTICSELEKPENIATEGVLRVCGAALNVDNIVNGIKNNMLGETNLADADVHTLSSSLKKVIRDMPFLQPGDLNDIKSMVNESKIAQKDGKDTTLYDTRIGEMAKTAIGRLPLYQQAVLNRAMDYFSNLAEHCEKNKMTASNIAVSVGQSLYNAPSPATDVTGQQFADALASAKLLPELVERIIIGWAPAVAKSRALTEPAPLNPAVPAAETPPAVPLRTSSLPTPKPQQPAAESPVPQPETSLLRSALSPKTVFFGQAATTDKPAVPQIRPTAQQASTTDAKESVADRIKFFGG